MTKIEKRLAIVLTVAFAIRMITIIAFRTYAHPVAWEYEKIVNNLLSGEGFVYYLFNTAYRSFNAPLYSFLCAGIYLLTNHSYFAVLAVQSLFSMFLALVIFAIAKKMFNENVALISASLVSFHPGFMYYDVFNLIPLSIDAFFIATVTLLFIKFKERPTPLKILIIGGLIGIATLTRGITVMLLPFLTVYLILFVKGLTAKRKFGLIIFFWVASFIIIAPWVIRNYIIHKQFVFILSTGTENFWRGNNKYAVGTSFNKEGKAMLDLWPSDFRDKIYALDEMGQKKFFEKEALAFIRNNPGRFLELYFKKIYYFWWFSPQSGIIYPKLYLAVYKYAYSVLLIFAALGLGLALGEEKTRSAAWLIIFVFMSICLSQSLFYTEGRHRWLVEPLGIVFFSYGIGRFYGLLRRRTLLHA